MIAQSKSPLGSFSGTKAIKRWTTFLLALISLAVVISVDAHHGKEALLMPEEAFRLNATVRGDVLRLQWVIADGYYLYRSKFQFRTDTPGVTLGEPIIPGGEMEILRDRFSIELPLVIARDPPAAMDLQATSQGCADNGDCYQPYSHTVRIELPAAIAGVAETTVKRSFNPIAALAQLGQNLGGNVAGDEFLNPDVAYVLSVDARDSNTVVARWTVANGYYLYRDKFKFTLKDAQGVEIGAVEIPRGKVKEDQFFGRMEVFYNEAQARIALQRATTDPTEITLDVGYQGCAEAGLCYPPITKTVALALPAAVDTPGATPLPAGELPEQDRIARSLVVGNAWIVMLAFFGFGLLLTFTPCVFPMIPILSSIIVSQGERISTRKAFTLSLVYVLAMAATYTVAGVFAGLFGQNLQALFQDPWILIIFSIVFVLLALSMFGFYELQIPSSWQAKLAQIGHSQQRGTFIGVGIMGFLSALIVGPCVAAPLAGALIYIGQTGDAVLGGTALFALSMGMGTPVLAVGTSAGKLLPKAGPWMNTVKAIFGVLLLAVAVYLIDRIVPGWITMLLWAALLIVVAIYMGALDSLQPGVSGWWRLWKGAGLVLMVYGVLLIVGAAGGGNDVFQPLKGVAFTSSGTPANSSLRFKRVKGLEGLQAELVVAAAQGKPVMLDYYADWCISCKELEKYTFSDPSVQQALANAVVLQTDVTANDELDQAMLKHFGLFGPPAILFFGPDGKERSQFRIVGFMNAKQFRSHIQKALGRRVRLSASR